MQPDREPRIGGGQLCRLCRAGAAHHQAGAGDDSPLVGLDDSAVDSGRGPKVVGVDNQVPVHGSGTVAWRWMSAVAIAVVLGATSQVPYGGVVWQTVQHLEGLRRLGFDAYYVEDHGFWPYDPVADGHTHECSGAVRFISELMEQFGFEERWAYRDAASDGQVFGLSSRQFDELWTSADMLINLTGMTELREQHLAVPVRLHLETDPVLAQIELASGNERTRELIGAHTHFATYGENFGATDCGVPSVDLDYLLTRPPVILDWWDPLPPDPDAPYTTVASWEQSWKDVEWNGQTYTWSKSHEFLRLIDLPRDVARPLELSLATRDANAIANLRAHGWRVRDASEVSRTTDGYREYIRRSWGEFTVAKDQNVRLRSGWFSDRAACYLAAARPVVTQDTGFGNVLPTGRGLFAFRDRADVLAAMAAIEADPEGHRQAARQIAEIHFRAETVLGALIGSIKPGSSSSQMRPTVRHRGGSDSAAEDRP